MVKEQLTDQERIERDRIVEENLIPEGKIDPESNYEFGESRDFDGLKPEGLRKLIEKGYTDLDEMQGYTHDHGEYLDFCERHPGFTMVGYLITNRRNDCRISIVGVMGEPGTLDKKGIIEFVESFRDAEYFEMALADGEGYYCRYD